MSDDNKGPVEAAVEAAMSPEQRMREVHDIGIGRDGEFMVVTIPLRKWALREKDGDLLISGIFHKAERMALRNMSLLQKEDRDRKLQVHGALPPHGGPGHA
jgi:hypothetical protein